MFEYFDGGVIEPGERKFWRVAGYQLALVALLAFVRWLGALAWLARKMVSDNDGG